ncbi:hypothetical protein [Nocardia wallacei]|uniref:hypothetical protein n=1 Tax=Nocardia wallacei TaxID=480035 RepID=UPI002453744E|nr:hypothetical protein [Nocardia wallacei]
MMEIVNDHLAVKVRLTTPTDNGFLLLAAQIGGWAGPLPLPSPARRRLLRQVEQVCERLGRRADVVEVTGFRAALRPPGEGARVLRRHNVRPARFDVVVLVRTGTTDDIATVRTDPAWLELVALAERESDRVYVTGASSPARIADVDHGPDSWFLFNYFHSDDMATNYDVWEYTAGWFQRNTDLPDSVPMQPLAGNPADFSIINHASWPTLRTFLPTLLFHPQFRSFVLANFSANGIAAQPIIYRRLR